MSHSYRTTLISGASLLAAVLLSACSGRATYEPPLAPEASEPVPAVTVPNALPSDSTGLLGGPTGTAPAETSGIATFRRADGVLVTAMRPIANPDDAERNANTTRQTTQQSSLRSHVRHTTTGRTPPSASTSARRMVPVAVSPVASPQTVQVVKAAPKPASASSQVKLSQPTQGPVRIPISSALPIPPDAKLAGLQAQLAPKVAGGLTLKAPTELLEGQSGNVELALPANLLAAIQAEAPKHGLGAAARSAELSATLSGTGYEITPGGSQTVALRGGKAASFFWVATRAAEPAGPLHVDVQSVLTGGRSSLQFALASLDTGPSSTTPVVPVKKSWLGPLDATGQRTVLGAFLVLVALFIANLVARNARETKRREERRRKFDAFTDYSLAASNQVGAQRESVSDSQSEQRRFNDDILSSDTQSGKAD